MVTVFERHKDGRVAVFDSFVDMKWAAYHMALAKASIPGTVDYSDVEFIAIDSSGGDDAALKLFNLAVEAVKNSDDALCEMVNAAINWGFVSVADVYRNGANVEALVTQFFIDCANIEFVFTDFVLNTIYHVFIACGEVSQ